MMHLCNQRITMYAITQSPFPYAPSPTLVPVEVVMDEADL
jgi:hypothetical protein